MPHHIGRRAHEIEEHARHAVDAGLDHDAGQEGRDVAGRHGMRRRQPDVERHDAGLDAEAEKEEEKGGGGSGDGEALPGSGERGEFQAAGGGGEEQEADQQHAGAGSGHQEIEESAFARFGGLRVEDDQEIGGDGQEFPGNDEEEDVGGRKDEG